MIKKTKLIYYIIYLFSFLCLGFSVVSSQYFYYDTGISANGYQQGCSEKIQARFDTTSGGADAGRMHIKLDKTKLIYETGTDVGNLRNNLLNAIMAPWGDWAAPTQPAWTNTGGLVYDVIDAQRRDNSDSSLQVGDFGFLNILFVPRYNSTIYDIDFGMDYDGNTTKTTLYSGGGNIIDGGIQSAHLTGTISVERKPCIIDSIAPNINDNRYTDGATKVINNGLDIDFMDANGQGLVPFVWTGGTPGIGIWTGGYLGNQWGINNQYGVFLDDVFVSLAGNGHTIVLHSGDFIISTNNKTWQYKDRDYNITATSGQLFDFGIEKTIAISYHVADRIGNTHNEIIYFNYPNDADISNIYPVNDQRFVVLDDPIRFHIFDDWAGVDSGSVVVTLSGLDNNFYGIYSGVDLNFSGVSGVANYPDYDVILNHSDFPTSGTIFVNIYGTDLENNGGILASWTFTTRPDCAALNCCSMKLQTGDINTQFDYMNSELYISGGNNAYFTGIGSLTGYINCNTTGEGLSIYKGHGDNATGIFMGFHDLSNLQIHGTNVRAILSGDTIVLSRVSVSSSSNGGGGGGGGLIVPKDYCPEGDFSVSYYDNSCGSHASPGLCDVDLSNYSNELKGAYLYSYMYGITTMCPIKKADLDGYLHRNHFAKMVSEFAINVLGKEPQIGKAGCDSFDDIGGDTEELKGFIKTACELNLMGLHSDGKTTKKSFYSEEYVTRAQFGTVFSRLLFGDKYNIKDESKIYKTEGYWYKPHLQALKDNGIMTKIDGDWPNIYELRGWVMLMMQRADNYGLFAGMIPVLNGIDALFQ